MPADMADASEGSYRKDDMKMFEKCGFNDIMFRVWRYKKWIALATAVAMLMGVAAYITGVNGKVSENDTEELHWVISSSYLVELQDTAQTGASEASKDGSSDAVSMANAVKAILMSDYTRERVYHQMREKYTAEQIIDALQLTVEDSLLTSFSLEKSLSCNVLENTSIVNFFVTTDNREFARDYIDAYRLAIEEIPQNLENCKVKYLGGVEDQTKTVVTQLVVDASNAGIIAVATILGMMLALLAVFFIAVFYPTVNRGGDMEMYQIPVLGEVNTRKAVCGKQSWGVLAQILLRRCEEHGWHRISVTSSQMDSGAMHLICRELEDAAKTMGIALGVSEQKDQQCGNALTLVLTNDVNHDPNAFQSCMSSDAVLLLEQYGVTKHRQLEDLVQLLTMQDKAVAGAIGITK